MGDTLKIFGKEFTEVAGFKAKDKKNNVLTYVKGGEIDGNNLAYGTLIYHNDEIDGDKNGTETNTGIDLSQLNELTIAFTVSANDFKSSARGIFSNGMENPSATQAFQMWTWGNGEVRISMGSTNGQTWAISGNICDTCNNWVVPVPFVFTYSDLFTKTPTCVGYGYYNNAIANMTMVGATDYITFTDLYIFPELIHMYNGARTSSMTLSDVKIYNTVLSQSQINEYITGAMS